MSGQPVAIKKLRAEGDPDLLRRFQLEIRTTASLRHKNIVTIHASGEENGEPYLVMEFLEGHTLKQVIQDRRPLSLLDKVRIMTQVAEGLAYAHSKGVVHRDVKPENIMLMPDDNVKIMDFGIALAPNANSAVTQTGGIIGTPSYFAPEQIEGYKANEQTDIFSFGDVYYELLTGDSSFRAYKNDWRALQIAITQLRTAVDRRTAFRLSRGVREPGAPHPRQGARISLSEIRGSATRQRGHPGRSEARRSGRHPAGSSGAHGAGQPADGPEQDPPGLQLEPGNREIRQTPRRNQPANSKRAGAGAGCRVAGGSREANA